MSAAALIVIIAALAALGYAGKTYLGSKAPAPVATTEEVQAPDGSDNTNMAAVISSISTGHQSTPPPSLVVPTSDLSMGSRGADVTLLQNFLQWKNILAPNTTTGYFGNVTLNAVKTYQLVKGIPADGVVNAITRTAWKADLSTTQ